jgi:3'(2'), 5'-bisphosphate nucleotidase
MHDLRTLALTAAKEGAEAIRGFYGNARIEQKADRSPVTEADTHAHTLIQKRLGESGIPILSEEDTTHLTPPYPELLWIIDPLDGTKGFIHGTDDFAVMIGLLNAGRPVLGVVHLPIGDVVYSALRGEGAYKTEQGVTEKLKVSSRVRPNVRGLLSVNHLAPYMTKLSEELEVSETIAVGSIGIKAGYIGNDKADMYVTRGALGEWDVCAPEIILTEAGGKVTDTNGNPLVYGNPDARIAHGIIFTNDACHEDVVEALGRIN